MYGKPQGTRSRGCVFRASWALTCPVNFSGHVVIFRGSWLRSGEKYRWRCNLSGTKYRRRCNLSGNKYRRRCNLSGDKYRRRCNFSGDKYRRRCYHLTIQFPVEVATRPVVKAYLSRTCCNFLGSRAFVISGHDASSTVFIAGEVASSTVFISGQVASSTVFISGQVASSTVFSSGQVASSTVFFTRPEPTSTENNNMSGKIYRTCEDPTCSENTSTATGPLWLSIEMLYF